MKSFKEWRMIKESISNYSGDGSDEHVHDFAKEKHDQTEFSLSRRYKNMVDKVFINR